MEPSDEPNKLSIDLTSIASLKAELLKKQNRVRLKRAEETRSVDENETDANARREKEQNVYELNKKSASTWGKKRALEKAKNEKAAEASKVSKLDDDANQSKELTYNESELLEKSRKTLEMKAKFYEKLSSGQARLDDDENEIFLVNFDKKKKNEIEMSQPENYATSDQSDSDSDMSKSNDNKLEFKQNISEQEYNQQLKAKWMEKETENLEKIEIHYEDIRFDEIRNLGVGHFRFSADKSERQEQMEFFRKMRIETKCNRLINEINKLKRQRVLIERLSKVYRQRMLRAGYTLDEIKESNKYEDDLEEIDKELVEMEESKAQVIATPISSNENETARLFDYASKQTSKPLEREWDKPKLREKLWEKQIEKLRNQRDKQFAPPEFYNSNEARRKNKK